MAKATARKRRKKSGSTPKIQKKIKKQKKITLSKSVAHNPDSDSGPGSEIQTLLEPFSKGQLIALVVDLASSDDQFISFMKSVAKKDVSYRKIFVRGLGYNASRQSIEPVFATYGEIEELHVVKNWVTGKSKGCAFITYKSWKSVKNLLKDPMVRVGNRISYCKLASAGRPGPAVAGIVSHIDFTASDFPQRKIYVSNVPRNASPENLRVFFEKLEKLRAGREDWTQ